MTARLVLPTLDPAMHAIAVDPTRFRVVNAGRRRGKSTLAVVVAADAAWRGKRAVWIAPVYRQSDEAFTTAKRLLGAVPVIAVRESSRTIRMPSGGEIEFRSGDTPDNLRGAGWDLAVFDEYAYADPELWSTVRPALAERRGRGLFISTPRRVNDHFHEIVQRGAPESPHRDPAWRSWTLPTSSAPHVAPEEIEAARASMPSVDFLREFDAKFVSSAGARVQRDWLRFETPPADLSIAMGVDLAISERAGADYTAAVVLGRAKDGTTWVLDAQRVRAPFHQVLQFVQTTAARWKPSLILVEDIAYQRAAITELMRTTQLPVRGEKPKGDKVGRFAAVESRIEQGVVRFAPGLSPAFIDELLAFPLGDHDDFVDALSMAWLATGSANWIATFSRAMDNFR